MVFVLPLISEILKKLILIYRYRYFYQSKFTFIVYVELKIHGDFCKTLTLMVSEKFDKR